VQPFFRRSKAQTPHKAQIPHIARLLTIACAFLVTGAITLSLAAAPAEAKKRTAKKSRTVAVKPKGPLTIVVSLGRQHVTVYDGTNAISSAPISSGRSGRRTPTGLFSILQKHRRHYSNLYGSAPMPNMLRITWSGVAMHAGNLPGYAASHGCIRLPYGFSKRLYRISKIGTRVVVAKGSPRPQTIRHKNLIKPLPAGDSSIVPEPVPADKPTGSTNAANMLLGVTTAHAAEPPPVEALKRPTGTDLTRASLKAYREQELVYLKHQADRSLAQRKVAADALKAANLEVRVAQQSFAKAKVADSELSKTISKATRASYATAKKMLVLQQRARKLETPLDEAKAQESERALEAEILDHEAEKEMARKEAVDLAKVIAHRGEILKAKQEQRNALLRKSTEASKHHSDVLKALNQAIQAKKNRDKPITVLVSRKTMKIYVRQGYDKVFTAPIEIEQPDAPLGTQFYSAYSYTSDGNDLVWHALTADRTGLKKRKSSRRHKKRRRDRDEESVEASLGLPAQTPKNALDRIELSDEIRLRLAELIKPGSALFISDEGVSYETGEYTEIIVQTH